MGKLMYNFVSLIEELKNKLFDNNINKNMLNEIAFIHISEIVLEKAFKKSLLKLEFNVNESNILCNIYPYIFENQISIKYPISEKMKLKIFYELNGEIINDLIGKLYEECLPLSKRKDIGQFYTRSNNIVEYMLDTINYSGLNMLNKKVIDPASGSGLLLVSAVSRLKKYMRKNNYNPKQILEQVTNNFYAIDIDPLACYIFELNILIEVMDLIVEQYINDNTFKMDRIKIYNGDFTTISNQKGNNSLNNGINVEESMELQDIKGKKGAFKEGFDFVISNPPYVTMYGRRSRNMNEEKRAYYNLNYDFVQYKKGNNKFNSIMFFIERAIKITCNSQKICFIIDMSFFETAFKDIRKYILENCRVESITVDLKEFDTVVSGQQIIVIEKESGKEKRDSNIVKWNESVGGKILEICQDNWLNCKEYKFYKPLIGYEVDIINKVEKYPILHHYFPDKQLRTCCALTGKTEEFMVTEDKFKSEDMSLIFPYLEGAKGLKRKFGILTHTQYLKYDYDLQQEISEQFKQELALLGVKNKKRIALGDRECYLSPKLFIRQSAKELIASYTESKYAANNSLYILSNKDYTNNNKDFLKYVCALINSNLLTFYAQKKRIIRMGNGKTPQIKISDLQTLCLNIDEGIFNEVVMTTEKILNVKSTSHEYSQYLNQLNHLIYEAYSISKEEILFIEHEINKVLKG
jgi:23S rRNA A1618 N6-methylase RlmF